MDGKCRQLPGVGRGFPLEVSQFQGTRAARSKNNSAENRHTPLPCQHPLEEDVGFHLQLFLFVKLAGFSSALNATRSVSVFLESMLTWPLENILATFFSCSRGTSKRPRGGIYVQFIFCFLIYFKGWGWFICISVHILVALTDHSLVFRLIIPSSGYSALCYCWDNAGNKLLFFSVPAVAFLLKSFFILCVSASSAGHNRNTILNT